MTNFSKEAFILVARRKRMHAEQNPFKQPQKPTDGGKKKKKKKKVSPY